MSESIPTPRPDHIPLKDAPRTDHMPEDIWGALTEADRVQTERLNAELEEEAKEAPVEKDK